MDDMEQEFISNRNDLKTVYQFVVEKKFFDNEYNKQIFQFVISMNPCYF